LIFDFATRYRTQHNTISPAKDFRLTEQDFNDFVAFISDKEYDYTTRSEKALEELKTTAEQEKYFSDVKTEYEALKNKMMHNKKEDLVKFRDEIMQLIREEIVSRYYFQNGRVEATFAGDPEIKKALEVLGDRSVYNSILNGTFASKK
jgi:carboxyl-terminal processing protease